MPTPVVFLLGAVAGYLLMPMLLGMFSGVLGRAKPATAAPAGQ